MTIIDRLREMVPDDEQICDVVVGIFWTYVRTQYGVAVSATAHRWVEDPPGAIIPWAGELIGKRVRDVADLYASESLTARSLANAAISASFPASAMTGCEIQGRGQDLLHTFCNKSNDLCHIALIGHFHFADELARLGHVLDIYELDPRCTQGEIPSSQIPQRLPQADIVVMTSSTIITHSTEDILAAARPDAIKMIVGPTVPLHPILWDYGFDAICASLIDDPEQVRFAAAQGGNHKQMVGARKVNFVNPLKAHLFV